MDPVALLGEYAAVKNSHDVEGMLRRTHQDCVYEEVGTGTVITGHAELRRYHEQLFSVLPGYSATVERIAGTGNTAVAWGQFRGVLAHPWSGRGRRGDQVEAAAVFVCEFRDGLLYRERAHIDLLALRRQLAHPADHFVDLFTTAWANPSGTLLADLFTEDATVHHPGMPGVIRGRAAIRRHFEQTIAHVPDLRLRPLMTSASGRTVFVHWRAEATVAGSPGSWDGIDRFDLRGARAELGVAHFDPNAVRSAVTTS